MSTHAHVSTCARRDQSGKSSFGAIYIVALRQQSLTDLEFLIWVRLTGQQTPRNYPSLFHIARDTGTPRHTQVLFLNMCAVDLNLGPHAYRAGTLTH